MNSEQLFMRNLVRCIEQGIVSLAAILCATAIAGISETTILILGTILIFVEAFSIIARGLITDEDALSHGEPVQYKIAFKGGVIILVSYLVVGSLPLLPYYFMDISRAFTTSIGAVFVILFVLSLSIGRRGNALWVTVWRLAAVSGASIVLGAIIGSILN